APIDVGYSRRIERVCGIRRGSRLELGDDDRVEHAGPAGTELKLLAALARRNQQRHQRDGGKTERSILHHVLSVLGRCNRLSVLDFSPVRAPFSTGAMAARDCIEAGDSWEVRRKISRRK